VWGLASNRKPTTCGSAVHRGHPPAAGSGRRCHGPTIRSAGTPGRSSEIPLRLPKTNYERPSRSRCPGHRHEWNEYRNPDFERMKAAMKAPVIFDGRNIYNPPEIQALGFTYASIGRPCGRRHGGNIARERTRADHDPRQCDRADWNGTRSCSTCSPRWKAKEARRRKHCHRQRVLSTDPRPCCGISTPRSACGNCR